MGHNICLQIVQSNHSWYCFFCVWMWVCMVYLCMCVLVCMYFCACWGSRNLYNTSCILMPQENFGSDPDIPSSCYLGIQQVFCFSISILAPCRGELGLLTFRWDLTWVMQFCQAFSGSWYQFISTDKVLYALNHHYSSC